MLMAIGGLFAGLILASTLAGLLLGRKGGVCPAVRKGQEILRQADLEESSNKDDYL